VLPPIPPVPIHQRPALPERLDAYLERIVAEGAAPYPLVALNTHVPTLGPYVLGASSSYQLLVYGGPLMTFRSRPVLGAQVNAMA
jgi:hypothetical protein